MPKIEIELSFIEELKEENKKLIESNKHLIEKLKPFNKEKIDDDTLVLAEHMFKCLVEKLFKEVGYKKVFTHNINFRQLKYYIGKNWYNSEELEIILGTTVSNKFKNCFIELCKKELPK